MAFALLSTRQAAAVLGVTVSQLSQAVYHGRLPEPQRIGDSFAWSQLDMQRAANLWGLSWRPTPPKPPRELVQMVTRPTTSDAEDAGESVGAS